MCCNTGAEWAEGKRAGCHLVVSLTELALLPPQGVQHLLVEPRRQNVQGAEWLPRQPCYAWVQHWA